MALKIPSNDRIFNYWNRPGGSGEPPEDFDPSDRSVVNADWVMNMMDKIVDGKYATKSFNIIQDFNSLPQDAEPGQTAYVLESQYNDSFFIYNGVSWINISVPEYSNIQGNIYEAENLYNTLLSQVSYDSTIANAIGGYKKGDRLLLNKNGIANYIESLIDNNTTEPVSSGSNTNIWTIDNLVFVEGVQSATNPLPTASADTLGQIYLNWQSATNVWVCKYNNNNYEWVSTAVSDVFTPYDTIYIKEGKNYFALYEIAENIYYLSQIGTSYFSSYVWIKKDQYHNSMPTENYIELTLGASETVYVAPADGWVLVGKKAGKTTTAWLQVSVVNSDGSSTPNGYYVNQYTYGNADVDMTLIFPIRKGRYFRVAYTTTGDTMVFKFLYATNRRA